MSRTAEEMTIRVIRTRPRPDYTRTAAAILEKCREFYTDPGAEAEYQEWKQTRTEGRKNEQADV